MSQMEITPHNPLQETLVAAYQANETYIGIGQRSVAASTFLPHLGDKKPPPEPGPTIQPKPGQPPSDGRRPGSGHPDPKKLPPKKS